MARELTPLQVRLIERARQSNSGRVIYGIATDPPPRSAAAARMVQRTTARPKSVSDLDADAIWAKWNSPPTSSLREQLERELHREPQPALDAEEIFKRWNAPKQ